MVLVYILNIFCKTYQSKYFYMILYSHLNLDLQKRRKENMNKNKNTKYFVLTGYVIHIQVDTYNEYADEALYYINGVK